VICGVASNPKDCGIKTSILKYLQRHHCACTVFTSQVHVEELLDQGFDGVFLSNGPGDPEPLHNITKMVGQLLGKIPIFGLCLGHQILALALGLKVYKLKYGHHGLNHPIRNVATGKIEIASHNHNFAIDPASLSEEVEVTHTNLNDHTIAGIRHKTLAAFSVQYHPEAAPGPQDSTYLFAQFSALMKEFRQKKTITTPLQRHINLFVRQSFTDHTHEDAQVVQQVLNLINSLHKKPYHLNLLTGSQAIAPEQFAVGFEQTYDLKCNPQNVRTTRLSLLKKADGLVVIRTAKSESTAFELSYNIYGGRRVPVFFAVSEKAPIRTTVLKDLEDQVDVHYRTFKRPEELLIPLQNFIYEIEAKKHAATQFELL
jgi:anthranilate/para-aminobenzoate synthase component II